MPSSSWDDHADCLGRRWLILVSCCRLFHHRETGIFHFESHYYFYCHTIFFPSHSKNWIAQSTSQFHNPISTPLLPQHHNIHFTIACSIFISHQNLSLNHLRMCFPIQCFNKSMLRGHIQSTFQCSRFFSISAYHNCF